MARQWPRRSLIGSRHTLLHPLFDFPLWLGIEVWSYGVGWFGGGPLGCSGKVDGFLRLPRTFVIINTLEPPSGPPLRNDSNSRRSLLPVGGFILGELSDCLVIFEFLS